jgi:capsular polysaccharide transport system permease protein
VAEATLLPSSVRAEFSAAAATQLRVVFALVLREIRTRFGKTSLGYIWAIVSPVMAVVVLAAIYTFAGRIVPIGDSLALFLATGVLPYRTCTGIFNRMTTAISSNGSLFTFPIVKPIDAMFARAILEIATSFVVCLIVLGGIWAFELGPAPKYPLDAVMGFGAMALLGTGIGSINAVIARFSPGWDRLFSLFHRPLFITSGIFYLPEHIPQPLLDYLLWNPLLHGVEWFRTGFYTDYGMNTLDRSYLLTWGVSTLLLGLAAERALRNKGRYR